MSVVRVFTFRTVRAGFDAILRGEMMPEMRDMAGLVDVFFGRQGPDDVGPRIVVSSWSSVDEMVAGVSDRLGVFHPEYLASTSDHALAMFEQRIGDRVDGPPPTILRTFRGVVRPGELDAYVDEVRDGVELDRRNETGPTALYLGATDEGEFITASRGASGTTSRVPLAAASTSRTGRAIPSASSRGPSSTTRSSARPSRRGRDQNRWRRFPVTSLMNGRPRQALTARASRPMTSANTLRIPSGSQ